VQRIFTVVDIIKQRKLQLSGHICRMPDKRLITTIMLDMVDGTDIEADHQEGGWMILWAGVVVHCRKWCDREEWRRVVTGLNGSQGP